MPSKNNKQVKRIVIETILTIMLSFVIFSGYLLWVNSVIDSQQERLSLLQEELARTNTENESIRVLPSLKRAYVSRMMVYQSLRATKRFNVVNILGGISCLIPPEISINEMNVTGDKLVLTGAADSVQSVHEIERHLYQSDFVDSRVPAQQSYQINENSVQFNIELQLARK